MYAGAGIMVAGMDAEDKHVQRYVMNRTLDGCWNVALGRWAVKYCSDLAAMDLLSEIVNGYVYRDHEPIIDHSTVVGRVP